VSLLLDALKKAEKAKEDAQRGDKKEAPQADTLSLAPSPEDAKRVMTRDRLPDISSPLEIMSDDLYARQSDAANGEAPALAPAGFAPAQPEAPAAPAARRPSPAAPPSADAAAPQRAAAQRVFQAKFKEPNPKLPFYIVMGALGAFTIGTIVYFWIQLRPPPALVNANPPPPSGEQPVVVAKAPPTPRVPANAGTPAASSAQAIPGLPGGPAAGATPAPSATRTAPSATQTAPSSTQPAPSAKPAPSPKPAAGVMPTRPGGVQVVAGERPASRATTVRALGRRATARVNPGVAAGYTAYQAGDLATARREYRRALRAEPRNIDALLGIAAVELRDRQPAAADAFYRRVLRLDPRNPHAQAGMLALRSQQVDPVAAESQVKTLLAREPQAEGLQFTLGNQYAQQGRWNEAQKAYFKALANDPDNPDFAYNLAVSLDHMRQVNPALQHYRLALKLVQTRSAGFDVNAVRARVAQLAR